MERTTFFAYVNFSAGMVEEAPERVTKCCEQQLQRLVAAAGFTFEPGTMRETNRWPLVWDDDPSPLTEGKYVAAGPDQDPHLWTIRVEGFGTRVVT